MSVSRRTKIIIGWLAVGVLSLTALVTHHIYQAVHKFAVEDSIHGTFYPVARALEEYEDEHGAPATNLAQIVPRYILQIPASSHANSVEYTLLDGGRAWQLSIHSRALNPPRIYCCRSTQKYTPDEEQRVILRYHSCWVVLKE